MTKSKREDLGQIVIRPPAGMRERIKAAAEANNRSMNAEIVATLEEKYPKIHEGLIEILPPGTEPPSSHVGNESGRVSFIEEHPGSAEHFVKFLQSLGHGAEIVSINGKRYMNLYEGQD